jgi:photosystem II stability/assembly factor-like uncharacterized protein
MKNSAIFLLFCSVILLHADAQSIDSSLLDGMEYRLVGPYRGGRSAAVTGVRGQRQTFYMGATGGGVWKTQDGGQTWQNVSDGFFGGSIGAVAVSEWDPNVVYVGGGEVTIRGNVSHGSGMWKSVDAGKTWSSIGLSDSRHIPRIRIHPRNPDLVYAAVLGHLFGPNEERGVYRSKDGGATWERILFVSNEAGAVDLNMDPTNPRVLYAAFWNVDRTPYSLNSGGPGSGLWKSTDGGDTWDELTGKDNGLPTGTLGIIGVTVSPVNPERIWAIVEAAKGGVFRSDDGGESWKKINSERKLRQRAWYYTRIYADTQNEDIVYVLNVQFWRSKDGGKSYDRISTPHGDHHDFWIDPDDADRVVVADDGGAQVSFDAGANFTPYNNQPTAQFYRVVTDNHFPYRIYGGQQDNSTVRIDHTTNGRSERSWESTAGGESAWIAPHPEDPDIVYGGSYDGYLTRRNHRTGERRNVNAWPDNPMGHGAEDYRYRFQWNFPIKFSIHDSNIIYTGANVLFRSKNEGQSWDAISPDLTRNDPETLKSSGGPLTQDNTSVEYYATIFTFAEGSEEGVIWTGSDDGLIYLTRDGGENWENVTPDIKIMPEWMLINDMVVDPFEPGGIYVAGTRYKSDDFAPYLYHTTDYGEHWTKITDGIESSHFTRTIQPDPERRGLLYAGTENGMYISFDDGANWQSFQQNLPIVPVTDLEWKDNDLVVATQGRAFWILEDLTPLHRVQKGDESRAAVLYPSAPTYRISQFRGGGGVKLRYFFGSLPDSSATTLRILQADSTIIKSYTAKEKLSLEEGLNTFSWNMRYPNAEDFDGRVTWAGGITGPRAVPGTYMARLITGEDSTSVEFEILQDPRSSSSLEDLLTQFDFLIGVRDKLSEVHTAIKRIRSIRKAIKGVESRIPEGNELADSIKAVAKPIVAEITEIEKALYQTKNRSGQDPLNFPIRLNDKLAGVGSAASEGDYRPTDQAYAVRDLLIEQIDGWLEKLSAIESSKIPELNALVSQAKIPAVSLDE